MNQARELGLLTSSDETFKDLELLAEKELMWNDPEVPAAEPLPQEAAAAEADAVPRAEAGGREQAIDIQTLSHSYKELLDGHKVVQQRYKEIVVAHPEYASATLQVEMVRIYQSHEFFVQLLKVIPERKKAASILEAMTSLIKMHLFLLSEQIATVLMRMQKSDRGEE